MPKFTSRWIPVVLALLLAGPAVADQESPPPPPPAAVEPKAPPALTGEACINSCDTQADQCMAEGAGDERKERACDREYSKCLSACN